MRWRSLILALIGLGVQGLWPAVSLAAYEISGDEAYLCARFVRAPIPEAVRADLAYLADLAAGETSSEDTLDEPCEGCLASLALLPQVLSALAPLSPQVQHPAFHRPNIQPVRGPPLGARAPPFMS